MPLCKRCRRFDLSSFYHDPAATYLSPVEVARKSALAGCELCALLYDHAFELAQKQGTADAVLRSWWIAFRPTGNGTMWPAPSVLSSASYAAAPPNYNKLSIAVGPGWDYLYFEDDPLLPYPNDICIAADYGSLAAQTGLVGGRFLGPNRAASEYLDTLKSWCEHCIASHPRCCQSISGEVSLDSHNAPLPTRCIEVTPTAAYLRETAGQTGSYITLSHRWNAAVSVCRTTTANYAERIAGNAPLVALTATFADAVTLARGLGVRYLWIDSLCIVQDSDDWDAEKWKMGQYYQQALLTIAVGELGDRGFLQMTAAPPRHMIRLPYCDRGRRMPNQYVYLYRRDTCADVLFRRDVDGSELLSRSWILQERLLSKRIVYFTANEVFVECNMQTPWSLRNDCISPPRDTGTEQLLVWGNNGTLALGHGFKAALTAETMTASAWRHGWYEIAHIFSATKLTQYTDHLAAISGIAEEFGKLAASKDTTNNYLCGLWATDICYGLMWYVADAQTRPGCVCGAPSWSWLSCTGPIGWLVRATAQPRLQILEIRAATSDTPYVTMASALRVRTKMQPLLLRPGITSLSSMAKASTNSDELRLTVWRGTAEIHDLLKAAPPHRLYTVCSPRLPTLVGGWAYLERSPAVGPWTETDDGIVGLALLVAAESGYAGRLVTRLFGVQIAVDHVLFVQHVGGDVYKRLGIGMVFGPRILEAYDADSSVELVLE